MQPDMAQMAWHALALLLEPTRLGILFVGVLIGLAIGVLPGLNGIVGLAMLIPFTYNMDKHTAFALLLGMAAVITSSDFITAVLFGVPGHVGAAATVIDGHAMARKGEAGRAFGGGLRGLAGRRPRRRAGAGGQHPGAAAGAAGDRLARAARPSRCSACRWWRR